MYTREQRPLGLRRLLSSAKYLFICIAVGLFCFGMQAKQAHAAITSGTGTYSGSVKGTSTTFSVNVPSGSNIALFVSVGNFSGTVASTTYNGVSMTQLWSEPDGLGAGIISKSFILANPATGSHNLTITCSTSCSSILASAQRSEENTS